MTFLYKLSWGALASQLVFIFLMGWSSTVFGQAILTAEVSKTQITLNDPFTLTVTFNRPIASSALSWQSLKHNFNVEPPRIRTPSAIIQGLITTTTEWHFSLSPKKQGNFTIPSFKIGQARTKPILIKVTKAFSTLPAIPVDPVTITGDLNKTELYIGESGRYIATVQLNVPINKASLTAPQGQGIEVHKIGEDRQVNRIIDGKQRLFLIRTYRITPKESGYISLIGARFQGQQYTRSHSIKATQKSPIVKRASTLTLNVKAKPSNQKGIWLPTKSLTLTQTWQPTKSHVVIGEPITRIIELKIHDIPQNKFPNISLNYPKNIRVYHDQPQYRQEGQNTIMSMRQVIIPRTVGEIDLPELAITWWNTQTEQSVTSKLVGQSITIKPSPNHNVSEASISASHTLNKENLASPKSLFFPWSTVAFASLWVMTLAFWYVDSRKDPMKKSNSPSTDSPLITMIQCLKSKQFIAFQFHYSQWDKNDLPRDHLARIQNEITKIYTAIYASPASDWHAEPLIKLLKKSKKHTNTRVPISDLAPIVPARETKSSK